MNCLRVVLSISFILLSLLSGQSTAKAADVLHLYTALDPNEAKIYVEAFTKDTNIKVEWVRLSAGEVLTRLKAEAKNPQVSVWFGG
ncbi:MAG: iron ABC transporter substrate-binding protein, partial [Deltaproteobacteria bacterium]|nr:iron ABC transporter substrate-binding protein [Deltaproteobacteria bacterium]